MISAELTPASVCVLDIVVVEDSTTQAFHLQHILERHRHHVVAARNGREALRHISAQLPDLVVTDINMPEMDGYELCRRIKDDPLLRHLPVILLTSLSDPRDILKGLECGADSFVVKPYEEHSLLTRIHSVLANRDLRLGEGTSDVLFAGHRYHLNSGRTQSIDLLLSTYETAIQKNLQLSQAKEELEQAALQLREKNAQLEADLELARELQTAFLPQRYPCFPSTASEAASALRFCHRYLTTAELGGDFFNILRLSDTQAGIFICDVMGHGVRAALVTAIIRGLVEELTPAAHDPARFLDELNKSLCGILHQTVTPLFASAFYAVIDIDAGLLRHANAGHPLPLLLSGDAVHRLEPAGGKPGAALGVFPDSRYIASSQPLAPADFLVFFTDGLYELEGPGGRLMTEDHLAAALIQLRGLAPAAILDELIRRSLAWSVLGKFEDDFCLVGVEYRRPGKE